MQLPITLNGKEFHLDEKLLPCLVTYGEKVGGSQFSITLIADMFLRGSKILFLTAYPMATTNFLQQTAGSEAKIITIKHEQDLIRAHKYQGVMIKSGDSTLLLKALEMLPDLDERVVFVKNMDVFEAEIIKKSLAIKKIIFSGNIDISPAKKELFALNYNSIIAFSQPTTPLQNFVTLPEIKPYSGYLWTKQGDEGIIKVEIVNSQ